MLIAMEVTCFECQTSLGADSLASLGETLLTHARSDYDWPYPDQAIRNYAEATQRLTGGSERLESVGDAAIHPVSDERIDDWLEFFDHDAFVGSPEWAACYCLEPHVHRPDEEPPSDVSKWGENRSEMGKRLSNGDSYGYLAYVDGQPAGWANASLRSHYSIFPDVDPQGPQPETVVGVSCFIVAPPYRRHGLAERLLDRVIADASGRGADWIEGYPHKEPDGSDQSGFRGPRGMYEKRGFEAVEEKERYTVMRLAAPED